MAKVPSFATSLDEFWWSIITGEDDADGLASFSLHSGTQLPTLEVGSIHIADSRVGFSITGPTVANVFLLAPATVISQDYRHFSFKGKPLSMFNNDLSIQTSFSWLDVRGTGGQGLNLTNLIPVNSNGKVKISMSYRGTSIGISAELTASDYPADTIWTIEADMVTVDGGAGQLRMIESHDVSGTWTTTEIIGWGDGTTGGNTLDSTFLQYLGRLGAAKITAPGKGNESNAQWFYSWIECFGHTVSGDGRGDGEGEDHGVLAVYPKTVDGTTLWVPAGNRAGCSNPAAALDDTEDDDDQTNDSISESESSQQDILFVVGNVEANEDGDINSTGGTVEYAAMTLICPESLSASDIHGLMKHDGPVEEIVLVEDAYTSGKGGTFYGLMPDTEGGDAWGSGANPYTVFNATVFGIRADALVSGKCWGMVIHVVGDNLVRPNPAQICVDPATRRVFDQVVS